MKFFISLFIICVFLGACQNFSGISENHQASIEKDTNPGKKLLVTGAEVWMHENCVSRKLPYLRLDQSEVVPKTVKHSASIRYRISYTACVPEQQPYILGRFETKISFGGKMVSNRSDDGYNIETGKWIVDTHIAIPKGAKPGTYVLDATIFFKGGMLKDRVSFNVER